MCFPSFGPVGSDLGTLILNSQLLWKNVGYFDQNCSGGKRVVSCQQPADFQYEVHDIPKPERDAYSHLRNVSGLVCPLCHEMLEEAGRLSVCRYLKPQGLDFFEAQNL